MKREKGDKLKWTTKAKIKAQNAKAFKKLKKQMGTTDEETRKAIGQSFERGLYRVIKGKRVLVLSPPLRLVKPAKETQS